MPELEVMLVGRHLLHPKELGMELGTDLHPHLLQHLSPHPLLTQPPRQGARRWHCHCTRQGEARGAKQGHRGVLPRIEGRGARGEVLSPVLRRRWSTRGP